MVDPMHHDPPEPPPGSTARNATNRSWSGPTHGGWPVHGCGNLHKGVCCGCRNLHRGLCTLPQPHHSPLTDMDGYGQNTRVEELRSTPTCPTVDPQSITCHG